MTKLEWWYRDDNQQLAYVQYIDGKRDITLARVTALLVRFPNLVVIEEADSAGRFESIVVIGETSAIAASSRRDILREETRHL